jgi:hypothetical protein
LFGGSPGTARHALFPHSFLSPSVPQPMAPAPFFAAI